MEQRAPVALLESVMSALESDTRLDLLNHPLNLSLKEDTLVLDGALDTIAAKKQAVRLATLMAEGLAISDRIRIRTDESREEGVLRNEVGNALLRESAFGDYNLRLKRNGRIEVLHDTLADCSIDVSVQEGVVTLEGCVGSLSHRRLAEVLMWWTAGCERVDNRLEVMPAEEDNDDELADAVRIVLEKDPLVHAGQLSVRVQGGTVTLDGYVASREEKRLAVLDSWYVPGVLDVVDRVQTRID